MSEGRAFVVSMAEVPRVREELEGKRIVATNGCFDLLHVGHLRSLSFARSLGDLLWVGINDDESVRARKGERRPVHPEAERAELLAALRPVDLVTIFPGLRATAFLRAVRPRIYVKGGDYRRETLDAEEREALERMGVEIRFFPLVEGRSTTAAWEAWQKG
ncbi:glycerol-3-phosphate cytidylyltransferase [Methylacidimicrobium cyclopophantes]|uniref:Glycerol-3-phosphate cytidylyltransferase n=1 Tax=Methylacidimicrobium cyclopophantes TaxID=1041766 RepID=A0A5E6ME10_9BACT|nr:adenylyltransferase/cytidyltransferase family protein [Methylacidimicrobium cyclopophantes]VVM07214.1 glycerol-3-phosphate cytidylyltransferase [Methylacidimicrobium cyclopophantes]